MKHMNNIDLETFKQLVRLKEFIHYNIHYQFIQFFIDIVMDELEKE